MDFMNNLRHDSEMLKKSLQQKLLILDLFEKEIAERQKEKESNQIFNVSKVYENKTNYIPKKEKNSYIVDEEIVHKLEHAVKELKSLDATIKSNPLLFQKIGDETPSY